MYTLPETNRAPENRSSQKEYLIFQAFILKGAKCGCREGILGHLMHGSSAREFIRLPGCSGKLLHSHRNMCATGSQKSIAWGCRGGLT